MSNICRFAGLCLIAGLSSIGCIEFPGEPVMPTWDVQVSAALAKTSHSIRDLVSDIASLPPEVLDTLDLSRMTVRYENNVIMGDTTGDGKNDSGLTGDFFKTVTQAHIFVEAVNGTPAALDLSLSILDQDGVTLLVIPALDSPLHLTPAPLDQTGKVGAPTTARATVNVDDGLASVFETGKSLTYAIDITFPENVRMTHVLSSDSLFIQTWGTFVARVDP